MPPTGTIHPKSEYVLGVDFARLGQDESVFIVLEKPFDDDDVYVVYIESTKHQLLTSAIGRVLLLDDKFHFKRIYLDETGLGAGPTDVISEKLGEYRVEGIRFSIDSKEDMYSNVEMLLGQGKLKLPKPKDINTKKLIYQTKDLRYETMSNKKRKIHHAEKGHDDFPDALALACLYFRVTTGRYHPTIFTG